MPTDTLSAMLVWTEHVNAFSAPAPFLARYIAVLPVSGGSWSAYLSGCNDRIDLGSHPTPEAARAACEADYERRCREAGLVPAGDVGLSTSAAAALLLGLHREGALEQSGDEAAQVAIEEQGADLNAQPVVEAFLIVLAPPGAALAAAPLAPTPAALADGTCVRCGAAPRNASGLCATCVDEDAVRAGELFAASAVSADAIRAEIAKLKVEAHRLRIDAACARSLELGERLRTKARAHEETAARLSALLPKPAQEEQS